jgi:hypothetical protein
MSKALSEEKKLEWKNLIEQQRQSGLSAQKWAEQNKIHPRVFLYWKNKLFPKSMEKSNFIELNIRRPDSITLQVRGLCIRMGSDCNPALRKQLISLFAEGSC